MFNSCRDKSAFVLAKNWISDGRDILFSQLRTKRLWRVWHIFLLLLLCLIHWCQDQQRTVFFRLLFEFIQRLIQCRLSFDSFYHNNSTTGEQKTTVYLLQKHLQSLVGCRWSLSHIFLVPPRTWRPPRRSTPPSRPGTAPGHPLGPVHSAHWRGRSCGDAGCPLRETTDNRPKSPLNSYRLYTPTAHIHFPKTSP